MRMTTTIKSAAFALAAAALPISAAQADAPRTATISYDDLNLSSAKGKAIFDRRIEAAVEAVCGRLQNKPTLDSAVRTCQKETHVTAAASRDLAVANYNKRRLAGRDRTIRLVAK